MRRSSRVPPLDAPEAGRAPRLEGGSERGFVEIHAIDIGTAQMRDAHGVQAQPARRRRRIRLSRMRRWLQVSCVSFESVHRMRSWGSEGSRGFGRAIVKLTGGLEVIDSIFDPGRQP